MGWVAFTNGDDTSTKILGDCHRLWLTIPPEFRPGISEDPAFAGMVRDIAPLSPLRIPFFHNDFAVSAGIAGMRDAVPTALAQAINFNHEVAEFEVYLGTAATEYRTNEILTYREQKANRSDTSFPEHSEGRSPCGRESDSKIISTI